VHSILSSMLHWTEMPNVVPCMLLSCQDILKHTPEHALRHTHSLLDYTLRNKLTQRSQAHCQVHSQIHSQSHLMAHSKPAWMYALKSAFKILSSTLSSTLPSTLSRGKTLPISLDYMLPSMLLGAQSGDFLRCRCQAPVGGRWVVVAKGMMSANIRVWIVCAVQAPWQDLMVPYGYGVGNCSLRFCRRGRHFNGGESRSPTQIFQQNLLLAFHSFWADVCAFRADDVDGDANDCDANGVGDGNCSTRST